MMIYISEHWHDWYVCKLTVLTVMYSPPDPLPLSVSSLGME